MEMWPESRAVSEGRRARCGRGCGRTTVSSSSTVPSAVLVGDRNSSPWSGFEKGVDRALLALDDAVSGGVGWWSLESAEVSEDVRDGVRSWDMSRERLLGGGRSTGSSTSWAATMVFDMECTSIRTSEEQLVFKRDFGEVRVRMSVEIETGERIWSERASWTWSALSRHTEFLSR